ncbi:MAG: class I SAM-dependent methyltransferase [Candidatus Limnocylindrales bacterium]
MQLDDRFDELVDSLTGFHRTWLIYIGVELGLFSRLRAGGREGVTAAELAASSGCNLGPIQAWMSAADAQGLADLQGDRMVLDEETAGVLLDDARPEFLGGQFVHAVVASLDWAGMLEFFRTGQPIRERPDRYRVSIERLTVQDVAVFFQEALAALPQLVADLSHGGRVVDIHCGGGRWLIAMATRFPTLELVGLEFEPDSVARARANVEAAGLAGRIEIRQGLPDQVGAAGEFDLAYFQYALHQLADPSGSLRAAWAATRTGGRLVVLDWALPSSLDEFRTRQGELIAGVQLDEQYQGTALATREQFAGWFTEAGMPASVTIDLASGASLFVAERS